MKQTKVRHLIVILGDQLTFDSSALDDFSREQDAVLQMEVREEATYVSQHKLRLILFFSAMRHFREEARERGWRVFYREVNDSKNTGAFAGELKSWCEQLRPQKLICMEPGDYRVKQSLTKTAHACDVPLEWRADRSFFCSASEFEEIADRPHKLILETFYERLRRKHKILMERGGRPLGGKWNFDAENRKPLPRRLVKLIPDETKYSSDSITDEVRKLVEKDFPHAPGSADHFDYPVTRAQALAALKHFIGRGLPMFGPYQDAMVSGQPYLFHSRLSSSLNMHLLSAQEVVAAAVQAFEKKLAPLGSVEAFVRQILGWREFVRGIYWKYMPAYEEKNALEATHPVPKFLWTAETEMNCVRQSVLNVQQHAYAHHIQRLMVLGLYCLLLGVHPYRFHEWHLSLFIDAIDWVSLPNALGMSQFGDGGIMGTKPYCASGNYIHRLTDYCSSCRYNPALATGEDACPFTTLYWDFLDRHHNFVEKNGRMKFQLLNLRQKDKHELVQIRRQADKLKQGA